MGYTVSWHQQNRIVLGVFTGEVDARDARQWERDMLAYLAEGTPPIHIIADMMGVTKVSLTLLDIRASAHYVTNPHLGYAIIVGGPMILLSFTQLIARLYLISYRQMNGVDEALAYLRAHDPTLDGGDQPLSSDGR